MTSKYTVLSAMSCWILIYNVWKNGEELMLWGGGVFDTPLRYEVRGEAG